MTHTSIPLSRIFSQSKTSQSSTTKWKWPSKREKALIIPPQRVQNQAVIPLASTSAVNSDVILAFRASIETFCCYFVGLIALCYYISSLYLFRVLPWVCCFYILPLLFGDYRYVRNRSFFKFILVIKMKLSNCMSKSSLDAHAFFRFHLLADLWLRFWKFGIGSSWMTFKII